MTELFVSAFVTLFVIIDPIGVSPIFASLTADASKAQARSMAIRATVISALILLGFAFMGEAFLGALGIELDAFRIAGGIMLFLIALEMIFEQRTKRREQRADKVLAEPAEVRDVSVFPMAIPMIAGPGSIATIMLLVSRANGPAETAVVLAAAAAILLLTSVTLLAAGPIMRMLGEQGEAVITRLLGVILAALAAQYVIDGIRSAFA
jgi:multiple antibiotic resistance protein